MEALDVKHFSSEGKHYLIVSSQVRLPFSCYTIKCEMNHHDRKKSLTLIKMRCFICLFHVAGFCVDWRLLHSAPNS